MIICLEGPDGAGKTTIANELQSAYTKLGYMTIMLHRGPIKTNEMIEYVKPLEMMCREHGIVYILDRWHVGELIYGPLLRDRSQLSEAQANYVEMVMQTLGAHFIHVTTTLSKLIDRVKTRGDDLIKAPQIARIAIEYDRYTRVRPHWEQWGEDLVDDTGILPHRSMSPYAGQYIGPKRPRALLIGDVRGSTEFMFPFVPRRATSGHWLLRAMIAARVPHMQIGIVNGQELHPADLRTLWQLLGSPPVVTLGNNANGAWRRTEAPLSAATQIYHPQYMRRFRLHNLQEYGTKILDVMSLGVMK